MKGADTPAVMARAKSPSDYVTRKAKKNQNKFIPVILPFLHSSKRYFARKLGVGRLPVVLPVQGLVRGKKVAAADPFIGAPASVLVLEEALVRGYKDFLFVGACGGLQRTLRVGDIVLPDEAISEEGTSRLYTRSGPRFRPDPGLSQLLEWTARVEGVEVKRGPIWTTDAPYRETPAKIKRYSRLGAIGVDMETSALFAVARVRKARMAGILVVSDLLLDEWVIGWKRKAFRDGEGSATRIVLETALRISKDGGRKPRRGRAR